MKSLLLRAVPLALFLAISEPAVSQLAQAAAAAERPAQMTAEQWREDLAFMAAEMKRRHANLYHTVSRQEFEAAVADLHSRIPTMQRNEIVVGLMRIAAMVGDGHTRVDPRKDSKFRFPSLPLKLYWFDDGVFVRAARPDYESLVGAEIVEIGGVSVAEAIRRTQAISSVDNEMGYRLFVPLYLNMPDVLHALKLSPTSKSAVLKLRKGSRTWTVAVPAGQVDPLWPPDTDVSIVTPEGWVDARTTPKPPLWLQDPLDNHRLVELPEQKALYAQLNMVAHTKEQTLGDFGKAIAERARATNPTTIILDLRLNQGGGGHLRYPFVRELIRAEDEDTRLVVLTWRGTFSASQFILDDLDALSNAILVGEPASSKPSSFGDAYRAELPNSGISVRTSIYWWQTGQNRDPWTWVDIAAPLPFAAYAAGRDPALEAGLKAGPTLSLRERLKAASPGGVEAVLKALETYRSDTAKRYANVGQEMAQAAEVLYSSGRREESLAVAQVAARDFPANVDAALVLAYLASLSGRSEIARREANRVLTLDPNNRTVRIIFESLKENPKQ